MRKPPSPKFGHKGKGTGRKLAGYESNTSLHTYSRYVVV